MGNRKEYKHYFIENQDVNNFFLLNFVPEY